MPFRSGKRQQEPELRLRVWIAVGVLGVCLLVLGITPVIVSIRTRALRHVITEVAEPTISAVSGIERAVVGQVAALRGFALHGDTDYIARYRDLRAEERTELARLDGLARELDPEIARDAARVARLADSWHSGVEASLEPDSGAAARATLAGLYPQQLLTEARSIRRSAELLERVRRTDIAEVEAFEVWLNQTMILLAAVAAFSLALLGRRLHALAAAARADRDRLAQEVSRRARLIRGISHDLKNPLGAADAHAEFLEMGIKGSLTGEQRESIGAIRRSVHNTVRLIDDLLQLARAERGELPVEPLPVDFADLIREVATDVRSRAEAENLRLEVAVPERPLEGVADPRRVREIVDNLLSNAIRYTPAGGAIALALRSSEAENGWVRIAVTDTGPGIAPVDQERIFQEFERAAGGQDGSGLGLAISREMARLLGGEIRLDSRVGVGSTFTLVLPRRFERSRPA